MISLYFVYRVVYLNYQNEERERTVYGRNKDNALCAFNLSVGEVFRKVVSVKLCYSSDICALNKKCN